MPRRGPPTPIFIDRNAMAQLRERRFVKHKLPKDPRGDAVLLSNSSHIRKIEDNILISALPPLDLPPLRALPSLPSIAKSSSSSSYVYGHSRSDSSSSEAESIQSVDSEASFSSSTPPYQLSRWAHSEYDLRPSQRALYAPGPARKPSDAPVPMTHGRPGAGLGQTRRSKSMWDLNARDEVERNQPRWRS